MKKRKSKALGDVLAQGVKGIKGVHEIGGDVGIVANTEAVLTAVVDNVRKAQEEYRDRLVASLAATNALNAESDKAATFITLTRENLKPKFGSRYNQTWSTVGFSGGTLKVPDSMGLRLSLVKAIEQFLVANPALAVVDVVTAVLAGALYSDLADAMAAAAQAKVEQRQKKAVRDAALAALRLRIQALRAELKPLLAADDPRWIDFGFNVPTDVFVTDAPEGVKLTLNAMGHLVASWDDTVNTDRFRVYQRVTGTNTEYVPVATTTDTTFDLGTFASGAHVDVQVTAINAAGESVPSQTVEIVVP